MRRREREREFGAKTVNKLLSLQRRRGFMGLRCPVYGSALYDGRFLSAPGFVRPLFPLYATFPRRP